MRKLFFTPFIVAIFLFTSLFSSEPEASQANKSILKIGVLLPLTGSLSFQGQAQAQAAKLAREEVETLLNDTKAPYRIEMQTRDTETNPEMALKQMQSLHSKGFKVFIGPSTSAAVQSCLSYAKENDLIMVSPSSTSIDLSGSNDNLYRLAPNDKHQSQALATLLAKEGIKTVITLYRGDSWGDSLQKSFKEEFQAMGGSIYSNVRYHPDTTIFSNQLKYLHQSLEKAAAEHAPNSIAVFVIGFDETTNILEQSNNNIYFSNFKWFGSDASANSTSVLRSQEAREFALKVQFRSPKFEVPEPARGRYAMFASQLQGRYKQSSDSYVATTYDAVKLIAHSYPWVQHYPNVKFWKKALNYLSSNSMGVTGWLLLNPSGERVIVSFSFWELEKDGSNFRWITRNSFHKTTPLKGEA